jgi:MFS family permease
MSLDSNPVHQTPKFLSVFKKEWGPLISNAISVLPSSCLFINILIFSNLLWPGDPFHAKEIGLLFGVGNIIIACAGLLFGWLVDRFSRIHIFIYIGIIYGATLIGNGFVPVGLGWNSFFWFFVLMIVRTFVLGGQRPLFHSYSNDSAEEYERSTFFGLMNAIGQVFELAGSVISTLFFQNGIWREFFWVFGGLQIITTIIIGTMLKEPKRGAMMQELKSTLQNPHINYKYLLNQETFRTTIIAPTNIIAFVEGIFTTFLISVPDFLILPYFQSPPLNISAFATSIIMILFGLPGGLIGSIGFAKLSDKLAQKDIRYRVLMIAISICILFISFVTLFHVPVPNLTPEQGNNLEVILSSPSLWIIALAVILTRAVGGIHTINQSPLLQKINLPEAQGFINSANQFLEAIGYGLGAMIAGYVLVWFNYNYSLAVTILTSIGIVGACLWFIAMRWLKKDINRISTILTNRVQELNGNKK